MPEVGDADAVRPSGLDARLHGGARVVDVHMDVPQPVAADHDEGVPEGVEPLPQPGHGRVLGLQEVDHLEGGAVLLLSGALLGRGRVRGLLPAVLHACVRRGNRSRRPARERLHQGREDRHQAVPARVDHSGALQGGQLARGGDERRAGALVRRAGHLGAVTLRTVGGVGGGRGDGQDGALDGVGHGLPGGGGGVPQGQPQAGAPGVGGITPGGEHLGHAAQQLGEDRAGVAPRADQRAVRHGAHGVGQRGPGVSRRGPAVLAPGPAVHLVRREDGLHRGDGGLDGQIEVRAGVPVGDGVDVDRVDLLARPPQCAQRQTAPGTHRQSVEEPLRHLRHLRLPGVRTWLAA